MEDMDIIELYFARDERAIRETSVKYDAACTGIAQGILGSPEDAEECVSETWYRAWNAIPPQRPRLLSAFLFRIVRNLSFSRWKEARAEKRGGGQLPLLLDELGEIVSGREDTEDAVSERELMGAINAFISALPEEKRYIFLRRYWYTDSAETIGRSLGHSENWVNVQLSRIRKKLRQELEERGYEI